MKQGNDLYARYRPLSSKSAIFNAEAIEWRARPTTAESTRTISETTYIIGNSSRSRPVSAVSVRLLRPSTARNMVEKAIEKPIFSKVNTEGAIDITEGSKTKYPPSKFPFLVGADPLDQFDGTLMEDGSPFPRRSSLKGSRPTTAKTRPGSAVSFRWDVQ